MNEITSIEKKPKDPRRVEAGKRLGAISKAVKEKKARERYDRERELERDSDCKRDWTCPIGLGFVVGLIGICYVCKRGRPAQSEPATGSKAEPSPPPSRKLDSFD